MQAVLSYLVPALFFVMVACVFAIVISGNLINDTLGYRAPKGWASRDSHLKIGNKALTRYVYVYRGAFYILITCFSLIFLTGALGGLPQLLADATYDGPRGDIYAEIDNIRPPSSALASTRNRYERTVITDIVYTTSQSPNELEVYYTAEFAQNKWHRGAAIRRGAGRVIYFCKYDMLGKLEVNEFDDPVEYRSARFSVPNSENVYMVELSSNSNSRADAARFCKPR